MQESCGAVGRDAFDHVVGNRDRNRSSWRRKPRTQTEAGGVEAVGRAEPAETPQVSVDGDSAGQLQRRGQACREFRLSVRARWNGPEDSDGSVTATTAAAGAEGTTEG